MFPVYITTLGRAINGRLQYLFVGCRFKFIASCKIAYNIIVKQKNIKKKDKKYAYQKKKYSLLNIFLSF